METTIQKIINQDQVKLNVGMGGKVGWEIKCYGDDALANIKLLHDKLKEEYSESY